MVTESYQKTKTPQIKFAGFLIITLPHRHIVSLPHYHIGTLKITSFSSRIVLKYKYFGFPLYLQSGSGRPKLILCYVQQLRVLR